MEQHKYYLKDFGLKMHINFGRGKHAYAQSGFIICPTIPQINGKSISKTYNENNSNQAWTIDGVDHEFKTGKELIDFYNLVAMPEEERS